MDLMNVQTSDFYRSKLSENGNLFLQFIQRTRTKIRQTTSAQVQENKFIRDSIDRGNMKIASIAKNIIAQYGIEPENIGEASLLPMLRGASY